MRILKVLLLSALSLGAIAEESEKTVIDLKVHMSESADLLPAQLGASVFLMQSEWAHVAELGEDVAVWLTDYDRKKNLIQQQVISLRLEIREPSTLRTGNLISEEKVIVRYWPGNFESDKSRYKVVNDLENLSNELKEEAYFLGVKIESVLSRQLKK